jgi:hypothetical protein
MEDSGTYNDDIIHLLNTKLYIILRVCLFDGGRENPTFLVDLVFFALFFFKLDFRRVNRKNKQLNGWKIKIDWGIETSVINGNDLKNCGVVGTMDWIFSGSKSTRNRESSEKT